MTTTIVKRELANGFIKATTSDGAQYRSTKTKVLDKGSFYDSQLKQWFVPLTHDLRTKEQMNENRDVTGFSSTYQKGLADEKKVIDFLRLQGMVVKTSTKEENRMKDIDCWIDGIAYSIKSEFNGLRYGNIYFELENQLTATGEWVKDGWYYHGQAEFYLILQGQELRMYSKQAIKDYVELNGWLRTRTLSWQVKAQQGGSYRTMDTMCGFLERDKVPYEKSWTLT